MTITKAPIILGEGITLFGKIINRIKLVNAQENAFSNDFIQVRYDLYYS